MSKKTKAELEQLVAQQEVAIQNLKDQLDQSKQTLVNVIEQKDTAFMKLENEKLKAQVDASSLRDQLRAMVAQMEAGIANTWDMKGIAKVSKDLQSIIQAAKNKKHDRVQIRLLPDGRANLGSFKAQ